MSEQREAPTLAEQMSGVRAATVLCESTLPSLASILRAANASLERLERVEAVVAAARKIAGADTDAEATAAMYEIDDALDAYDAAEKADG